MTAICLEGALAVGKSSTAAVLAEQYGAFIVPEMNRLFRPPEDDPDSPTRRSFSEFVATQPPGWYLERQAERWTIAAEGARAQGLAVLDRDPFQPLWYRWAFRFEGGGQTLAELRDFYRPRLVDGTLRFPDGYILLTADLSELERRSREDTVRQRRGFDKQKTFIEPQKRYFEAMAEFAPGMVAFVRAESVAGNVAAIQEALPRFTESASRRDDTVLFDALIGWLETHSP